MSGRGVILGGPNARFQRRHGDIMASYQYINDERAMVLWPMFRKGATAFVVCDSSAWKYDDPVYLARQAKVVSEMWGEAPDSKRWFQIASIIHDGLPDLVRMKPAPDHPVDAPKRLVIGEAVLRAMGRELAGGEVTMPTAAELLHYERNTH